jgi:hypothetical protein
MDIHKNYARSTLSAGIAAGAGSFTVAAGEGAKFGTAAQYISIWNSTDYACADLDPNKEIVRVSSRSTDTFTISAKGQGGTSDVAHNTGGKIYTVQQCLIAEEFDAMLENVLTTRGDIVTRGASAPQRLAVGAFGDALTSDGVDPNWLGFRNEVYFFDDFLNIAGSGNLSWTVSTVGSGAIFESGNVQDAGHPGNRS